MQADAFAGPVGHRGAGENGAVVAAQSEVVATGLLEDGLRLRPIPANVALPVDHAPILRGAHADVATERRDEVGEAIEPRAMADLGHAQHGIAEELGRVLDAQPDQVPVGGTPY